MSLRVLLYVQHLLGVGHLMRAARLAGSFAAAGAEVALVSGGMPVRGLPLGGASLVQLAPARSRDERFGELVDEAGAPLDEAWCQARRASLLAALAERRPDVVIIEMFPFGRRAMRFELLPLLDAALAEAQRPLIVASVRDIVQGGRKPGRAEETLALAVRAFDLVLVHGDPQLVRFEESYPLAAELGERLRYTGYIAPPAATRGAAGDPGWGEVVVSAGGGAVGAALLAAAFAAQPLGKLAHCRWRLLAGGNLPEAALAALAAGASERLVVERARPDFGRILANCRISVSQAGYNTVMDIATANARAVLVPFAGLGETEQALRAEKLAARGLAQVVPERGLTPERLASAIDAADAMAPPSFAWLDLTGAETGVRIVTESLSRRRARRGA
ncbi:MAG: glycosyltransferase family protein [Alphaproteobacteria bacterium]